jgi:5'-deoxynucleotidase YfbR-like HD superfamily hydrolase
LGWRNLPVIMTTKRIFYLTQAALTHDLDELYTGDIVTFVKKKIINAEYANDYVQAKMKERMPVIEQMATVPQEYADDIKLILKAADWLDATFFLANEKRIGNKAAEQYLQFSIDNLKEAWFKLPYRAGYKTKIQCLWDQVVYSAVKEHTKVKEGI